MKKPFSCNWIGMQNKSCWKSSAVIFLKSARFKSTSLPVSVFKSSRDFESACSTTLISQPPKPLRNSVPRLHPISSHELTTSVSVSYSSIWFERGLRLNDQNLYVDKNAGESITCMMRSFVACWNPRSTFYQDCVCHRKQALKNHRTKDAAFKACKIL